MAWDQNQPVSTDSISTSQGTISGNFIAIQGVLGSSTLTDGITLSDGDILYASNSATIVKLAAASASAILTNWSSGYTTPSWAPSTSIAVVGTITTGTWNGDAIDLTNYATGTLAVTSGGTGVAYMQKGVVSVAAGSGGTSVTLSPAFPDTNYIVLLSVEGGWAVEENITYDSKAAASFKIYNYTGATRNVSYLAMDIS